MELTYALLAMIFIVNIFRTERNNRRLELAIEYKLINVTGEDGHPLDYKNFKKVIESKGMKKKIRLNQIKSGKILTAEL